MKSRKTEQALSRRISSRPISCRGTISDWFRPSWLPAIFLVFIVPSLIQAQQAPSIEVVPAQPGSVSGTIVDMDGALIANVRVTCAPEGAAPKEVLSNGDGYFICMNVPSGPFQLTFALSGFAPQEKSGVLP